MPKCLCSQIPDILERLSALEGQRRGCSGDQQEREELLNQREQQLQQRAQQLEKAAVQLQDMGKKMQSSQSSPQGDEMRQQLQKQQQVIEVLSQIQGQTNKLFGQVYNSLQQLLDLPELEINEQDPMALLQGLANMAEAFMKVAPLLEICKRTMAEAEAEAGEADGEAGGDAPEE